MKKFCYNFYFSISLKIFDSKSGFLLYREGGKNLVHHNLNDYHDGEEEENTFLHINMTHSGICFVPNCYTKQKLERKRGGRVINLQLSRWGT